MTDETRDAIHELEEAMGAQGVTAETVLAPARNHGEMVKALRRVLLDWRTPNEGIALSGVVYGVTHWRIFDKSICGIDGVGRAQRPDSQPSCEICRARRREAGDEGAPLEAEYFVGLELDELDWDTIVRWAVLAAKSERAARELEELLR